jgi:glycosyltransferase involved in cell wall biosynthesis
VRVAVIVPGHGSPADPWAVPVLRDLVAALARRVDVTVLSLRYPHERGGYDLGGVEVVSLGAGTAGGWRRLGLAARAAAAVRALPRRPVDVVHGLWADEPGAVAVAAGRLLGAASVVSVMGGELVALPNGYGGAHSRANRILARLALRRADAVTVPTAGMAAWLPPGSRTPRVMPAGVDVDRFAPSGPARDLPGDPALLHVASLTPVKDQPTLLRALGRIVVDEPRARLHVVGTGPEGPRLWRLAADLDVADHVTFHGRVAHEDLPAWYRGASLCVQSSRFESQGLAVVEAAACGTPPAGTAVGILPDLAPDHAVRVGDPQALAAVVRAACADRAALAASGAALSRRVRADLSLEHRTAALVDLYGEVSAARATRTRPMRS